MAPKPDPSAEDLKILALLDKGETATAVALAKDQVETVEALSDKTSLVIAQETLARAYLADGYSEDALTVAQDALATVQEFENIEWEADILKFIMSVQHKRKNFDEVQSNAWTLWNVVENSSKETQAAANAYIAEMLSKGKKYDAAVVAGSQALEAWQTIGDSVEEAKTLLLLAGIYSSSGETREAVKASRRALKIFQENGDNESQIKAYRSLVEMHQAGNELEKAMSVAKKQKAFCRDLNDKKLVAEAMDQIARLTLEMGDAMDAQRIALEAHGLMQSAGDKKGEAAMLMTYIDSLVALILGPGDVMMDEGSETHISNLKKAAKAGLSCYSLASGSQDLKFKAAAAYYCARAHLLNSSYGEAVAAARESSKLYNKVGEAAAEADSLMLQAMAFKSADHYSEAVDVANNALKLYQDEQDEDAEESTQEFLKLLQFSGSGPPQLVYVSGTPTEVAMEAPVVAQGEATDVVAPEKKGLDEAQVRSVIMDLVATVVGDGEIFDDSPLMESGLDSLSSVQFRNDLNKSFNMTLPASLTFDYPTPAALTGAILAQAQA